MRSSYKKEDVTILLKDITGLIEPMPTQEREKKIQSGTHYCEMLPLEYKPTQAYMEAYQLALQTYAEQTAAAVVVTAEKILRAKGKEVVLVSLARAGTPVGILLRRYLQWAYGLQVPHYTVSIIRGRGIDDNAMQYLLKQYRAEQLQFVDGWTGKGAICRVLKEAVSAYTGVSATLAVLADPANMTQLCGTHEDILIPSSCLNSTVSGLISRTFLRSDIIGEGDFHGAVYYGELAADDVTYEFINTIERKFHTVELSDIEIETTGLAEVHKIAEQLGIADINLVKPGIGETTRVLLRRVPWKILIRQDSQQTPVLKHIYRLAQEKQVEIVPWPLQNYQACGIIRQCSDV